VINSRHYTLHLKVVAVALWLACGCFSVRAQRTIPTERLDTIFRSFRFMANESRIEFGYGNNEKNTRELDSLIMFYLKYHYVQSIEITAHTSWDGEWDTNRRLSTARANAVKEHLLDRFPSLRQISILVHIGGEDWNEFRDELLRDSAVPLRDQVLRIVDNQALSFDKKELRIRKLNAGNTYTYLSDRIFPLQRRTDLQIVFHRGVEPQNVNLAPVEATAFETASSVAPVMKSQRTPTTPTRQANTHKWENTAIRLEQVKTNLLYLAAGVFNVGAELSVGQQFSLDVPFNFSPYTMKRDYRIRVLSIQPELRWWTGKQLSGHFFGLHTHVAYYNVALNVNDRKQDKNGSTPLWGVGASYGYALPIGQAWQLEFTAGLGYARLVYDTFHNVTNGAKYATSTKNYWGITRAGISLSYRINNNNNNGKWR
jgi:hypothetical protein